MVLPMDQAGKKQRIAAYKQQKSRGGIYAIRNTCTGRALLLSAANLQGAKNRFAFSLANGSCIHPKLQEEWEKLGPAAFRLEILEELEQNDGQSSKEFQEDLKALEEMYREKIGAHGLY